MSNSTRHVLNKLFTSLSLKHTAPDSGNAVKLVTALVKHLRRDC